MDANDIEVVEQVLHIPVDDFLRPVTAGVVNVQHGGSAQVDAHLGEEASDVDELGRGL